MIAGLWVIRSMCMARLRLPFANFQVHIVDSPEFGTRVIILYRRT